MKPSNLLLDKANKIWITDFGLAKQTGGDAPATSDGRIMGTPAYMAPEQAIGRADTTADVFSLGAILYEILTGQKISEDADDTAEQLDGCGCDRELAELAEDCLQRNEADRPRNAGVVATRISDYRNAYQARLKEAEIATARAEVKAAEERKRRHRLQTEVPIRR